ncbi:MAG: hypothetical protein ACR2RA_15295 [Geminicoccaceae bacterium]
MADTVALRYQNRDVVFEKSRALIAVRARAGMATAMHADIDSVAEAGVSAPRRTIGAFDVVTLRPSMTGLEQTLDWLRARPSVAAASHVFTIRGEAALKVPDGHLHLRFAPTVPGHEQQAVLTRYRLQAIEERGNGDYLVRITSGSKNPLATSAALQAEPGIALAEPEFVEAA